jgi:Zn-dependent protease with chaperone function
VNPNRVFVTLLGAGLIALALLVSLGLRFAPCLAIGSACWLDAVGSVCRLLDRAGFHERAVLVGVGLLAVAAVSFGRLIWSVRRQLRATRRFLATIRPGAVGAAADRLARAAQRVGIAQPVVLVAGPGVFSGCVGLWRPRIVVSETLVAALTPRQLEAILWHERYHLERRDPLRLLVGRAVRDGLSWLPVIGALERHFELLVELAADRQAVAMQRDPSGLAGALGRLLAAPKVPSAVAVAGISQTAARIDSLLDPAWHPRLDLSLAEWGPTIGLSVLALCLLFL